MGNGDIRSLIESLGVLATQRETAQIKEFLSFLVGNIDIRQTLSTHNTNRHCRVRFLRFGEATFVETAVFVLFYSGPSLEGKKEFQSLHQNRLQLVY